MSGLIISDTGLAFGEGLQWGTAIGGAGLVVETPELELLWGDEFLTWGATFLTWGMEDE